MIVQMKRGSADGSLTIRRDPIYTFRFEQPSYYQSVRARYIYNCSYDRAKLKCSTDYCQFSIPQKLLTEVDMQHVDYWFNMTVLIMLYITLNIVAYIILNIRVKKRI